MTKIQLLLAKHLEVPKEFILEFKEYPDKGTVNVLLTNFQKHVVTKEQLQYAEEQLEAKMSAPELTDIVGLGRTSHERLVEAGIETLLQLRDADAEQIALIVKQSPEVIRRWQEDAQGLLGQSTEPDPSTSDE